MKEHICVYLEKGGCAEYKYKFSFIKPEGECETFVTDGIRVIIPVRDIDKLSQIEIDHESNLLGEKFVISHNPYVTEKCGCGISIRGAGAKNS